MGTEPFAGATQDGWIEHEECPHCGGEGWVEDESDPINVDHDPETGLPDWPLVPCHYCNPTGED